MVVMIMRNREAARSIVTKINYSILNRNEICVLIKVSYKTREILDYRIEDPVERRLLNCNIEQYLYKLTTIDGKA